MNSEKSLPSDCESALIISCGDAPPEHVILNIIGVESPSEALIKQTRNVRRYPWSFETKYYTAEINLCAVKKKAKLDTAFCHTVRAVVFYFDEEKESSFDEVLSWMPFLKNVEAEVQLMICNNNPNGSVNLDVWKKFLNWCVKNQYELIKVYSSPDSDDEEDGVRIIKGYERVIEALQSHTWANLVLKSETNHSDSAKEDTENKEDRTADSQEASAAATKVENNEKSAKAKAKGSKKVAVEGEELQLEEKWLNSVLIGDDPSGESLEALFGKFASMKERANGLTGEERKKYAEKVAIAFWEAMGGDKDEIDGLDDLED